MRRITVVLFLLIYLFGGLQAQDPREHFKFAKFKYDNGDFKESLDFLNKALAEDPSYVNAYYLRAETNYELERYYSCISDINSIFIIEKTTTSFTKNYFLTRGKSYLALENFPKATADFEKFEKLSTNKAEVYYYKAKLEMATENFIEALENMKAAIRINPKNSAYYAFRSELNIAYLKPLLDSRGYYEVLDDINIAIALTPGNYSYYQIRSSFFNSMGNLNSAIEDYNKMIELFPFKDKAYTERGVVNLNNYEYKNAVLDFSKSVKINPDEECNYRYRGLCYSNMSNYSRAYDDFSTSIDLQIVALSNTPNKFILRNILAETYLQRGHCLNLMGSKAQACQDFLMAHNLGVKKGLNYYRKYCGIY